MQTCWLFRDEASRRSGSYDTLNREARTSSIAPVASTTNTFNSRDWLSGDTYDANGNTGTSPLTAYGLPLVTPDTYDFEDHLIIRHKPDGSTVNLSYDADGLLRQKTVLNAASLLVSATGYLQDSMNPTGYAQIMEERINTTAGTTVKTYAYGSDLISQITTLNSQPSTLRYFTYDGLGSVRELTNESGTITDAYDYDAFGNLVYRSGTTDNAYLYRGERFESDIGQYYLRARFYNQSTGRFWNQDSYEGSTGDPASLHKYLYGHGNPVTNLDPSGHMALFQFVLTTGIIGTLEGMAVRAVVGAATGALAQMRLYHLLDPLANEMGLLADEISPMNIQAGDKIRDAEQKLRELISPLHVAQGVAIPAAAQAFLGRYAPAVTVGRLITIEIVARRAVELAANGLHYENGEWSFSVTGDLNVNTAGLKAFAGFLNPARDVAKFRSFVQAVKEQDISRARHSLNESMNALVEYGSFQVKFMQGR